MNVEIQKKKRNWNLVWVKTWLIAIGTIIGWAPTWISALIYYFIGPSGFWQKLALLGMGLTFVGGIQFVLFIMWAAWTFFVYTD